MNLLQEIDAYKTINLNASQAVYKLFANHLITSDYLVGFAFFDRELNINTKLAMVQKIKQQSSSNVNAKNANRRMNFKM